MLILFVFGFSINFFNMFGKEKRYIESVCVCV